ncbi:hypothetical protein MTO96_025712 [Rhipicephalus appendiculatus]
MQLPTPGRGGAAVSVMAADPRSEAGWLVGSTEYAAERRGRSDSVGTKGSMALDTGCKCRQAQRRTRLRTPTSFLPMDSS